MLTLNELSAQIQAYRNGEISLEKFENWFEDCSTGAVYDDLQLRAACAVVDAAFSGFYFDHLSEDAMKQELVAATRPFEPAPEDRLPISA